MAEKILKTRIRLLTKSYAEWQAIKDTFTPLAGEVCVVSIPASTAAVVQEPAILFKVGDGSSTFASLPYASATAADVYDWAKKSTLDWNDLDETFKTALKDFIGESDTQYQIVADGTSGYAWKLQKSTDGGTTWVDATGKIDITALEARVAANEKAIAKKVDTSIETSTGKSLVFNESDGGGVKFENTSTGINSFVGVNDGSGDIYAQLYAIDTTTNKGVRLNVTKNAIYYTKTDSIAVTADDELVTVKQIKDLEGALHYIGSTEVAEGETADQAIARLLKEKSHTAVAGDVVLLKFTDSTKEYIYDGSVWQEFGDENVYATKAALQNEIDARTSADTALGDRIDNLAAIASSGNVNDLVQTSGDVLILDCNI